MSWNTEARTNQRDTTFRAVEFKVANHLVGDGTMCMYIYIYIDVYIIH